VLNTDSWQQVKELLEACLELRPAERGRFLEVNCSDSMVRAEVLSLLEAYSDSESFLDDSNVVMAGAAEIFQGSAAEHHHLGPYRILEELGQGGMGTVYRAVRDDDAFQIEVALKVVRRGMDSDLVLKRFRTERQILASLHHPYIARILDGGTTPSGLPYFVMEYVEGRPINRYCDEERLTITERIALFRKVCEAVSYAHQSLVLHRDLKPGNILVTADGTPKLLDFGIGKILNEAPDDDSTLTAMWLATPAYASPEQISGGLTGVASDVYSLGVLLYELLTGHPPYRLTGEDSKSLAQVIREREPTRASVVAAMRETTGSASRPRLIDPVEIAYARRTYIDALQKRLRGDVDNILAKALRKESQDRYASVEQLSEDLGRHLEGMPVTARKGTCRYRAAKFVRRHRVGFTATAAAVLALFATTTVAVWNAHQLSRRVEEDHKLASHFLVEVHDSIAKLPGSTPARETLLRHALDYMNGLARDAGDDPLGHRALALAYERFAELQSGAVAGGLGQSSAALETYKKAQAIREALVFKHPHNRELQFELANSYLLGGVIIGRRGSSGERIAHDNKAREILERLVAADPASRVYRGTLARAHTGIAYALSYSERWAESREHFRKALDIRSVLVKEFPDDAAARRGLALLQYRIGASYVESGEPDKALSHLRDALALQTAMSTTQPANHQLRLDAASTRHFLGIALGKLNRHGEALEHLNTAIQVRETALRADPLDARARSLLAGNYAEKATVLLNSQQPRLAVAAVARALELQQRVLEIDPKGIPARMATADFYRRAGGIYIASGKNWEGRELYARASELYESLRSAGHITTPRLLRDAEEALRNGAR
jgi:non-specific serine/threonine protein kinase/serine/threonine-protein kinase